MGAHTPGPWEMREASPNWEIFGEGRSRWVAYAPKAVADEHRDGTFYPSRSETAANARLIAAAPEMLKALERLIRDARPSDWDDEEDLDHWKAWVAADSAIAKARGQ